MVGSTINAQGNWRKTQNSLAGSSHHDYSSMHKSDGPIFPDRQQSDQKIHQGFTLRYLRNVDLGFVGDWIFVLAKAGPEGLKSRFHCPHVPSSDSFPRSTRFSSAIHISARKFRGTLPPRGRGSRGDRPSHPGPRPSPAGGKPENPGQPRRRGPFRPAGLSQSGRPPAQHPSSEARSVTFRPLKINRRLAFAVSYTSSTVLLPYEKAVFFQPQPHSPFLGSLHGLDGQCPCLNYYRGF